MKNPSDLIYSNFDGQVEDGLSISAESLCTAAPSLQKKIGEGVSVGGGDCTQGSLRR